VLIRRERPEDVADIRAVTAAAFSGVEHSAPPIEPDGAPGEATLVGWLREDPGWIPELSLVAEADGEIVGSWRARKSGRKLRVELQAFEALSRRHQEALVAEAESIAPLRDTSSVSVDVTTY